MKILGHPVHMMLVHFPAAFFPASLLCSVVAWYSGNAAFYGMAFYATAAGVVTGWIAAMFGAMDLLTVLPKKKDAINTALVHAGINTSVVIIFTVIFYSALKLTGPTENPGLNTLLVKGFAVILLLAGNYFGGNLVLKYKVAE